MLVVVKADFWSINLLVRKQTPLDKGGPHQVRCDGSNFSPSFFYFLSFYAFQLFFYFLFSGSFLFYLFFAAVFAFQSNGVTDKTFRQVFIFVTVCCFPEKVQKSNFSASFYFLSFLNCFQQRCDGSNFWEMFWLISLQPEVLAQDVHFEGFIFQVVFDYLLFWLSPELHPSRYGLINPDLNFIFCAVSLQTRVAFFLSFSFLAVFSLRNQTFWELF